MSRPTVERGAQRALAMRRSVSAWCRQVYSLLELLADRAVPPLARRNTPSIRQCRLRRRSNLESHLLGRTQADSRLVLAKALEWHALSSRCRRNEPFPTNWVSVGAKRRG